MMVLELLKPLLGNHLVFSTLIRPCPQMRVWRFPPFR